MHSEKDCSWHGGARKDGSGRGYEWQSEPDRPRDASAHGAAL